MLEYHAAYYPTEDGWYVVNVLDYPGVVSQGRTLNSARRMIKDALRMMVEWNMEEGRPLPRPNRRARDKKAVLIEPIRVMLRLAAGAKS